MATTKKKPVKDVVKAKAAEVKAKVKGIKARVKGKFGKSCAVVAALALAHIVCGCSTADPASRSNENSVGDIEPSVKIAFENSTSNVVNVTIPIKLSDGLMASADSKGSTETQTATATTDVKPQTDLRYNDAIGAGGNAVSTFVSSLTSEGMATLRDYVFNKKSGKITVARTDGTTETLDCVNGTCTTSSGLKIDSQNCTNCGDPQ